jgi:hypothetical protein
MTKIARADCEGIQKSESKAEPAHPVGHDQTKPSYLKA